MISYDEFYAKWRGKKADWDGAFAGQCVDLFRYYCDEVLGIPQPDGVYGAANFWYDFDTDPILVAHFNKLPNTPDFVPIKGDVVVWDWEVSASTLFPNGFGHIGMANGDGDINWFKSFDQNWTRISLCKMEEHNYNLVLGVLRPKNNGGDMVEVPADTFEELVTKSTKYDEFVAAGYSEVADVQRLKTDLNNCRDEKADLQRRLDECEDSPVVPEPEPDVDWVLNGKTETYTKDGVTVTKNYAVKE